ncbi:LysR family transcriptional regulator [Vibrio coralliilyticus]|uniref:LysR family transcriptional regulator n=1 Tax=Vibrio coralliilyticus TaxID=190893 RepID=UPI0015612262|nr:LysR family transcriptional regulator [Vibrio coralliilyticus]NRF61206.1 LysR family transcriptional regulator [Vibrio coralliilyticus]
MDWNLNDLPIFIAVTETGSVSKAAKRLGNQKSSVSRAINRLEESLNIKLLERNSRHLNLTSDGEQLYNQLKPLMQNLSAIKEQVPSQSLCGTLSIATTFAFSREILSPNLKAFTERYPDIQLSIRSMSHRAHLLEDKLDLAIQLGDLAPSGFYAKRLTVVKLLWFCTPEYLLANPELQSATLETLQQHVSFYHDQENNQSMLYSTMTDGSKQTIEFKHANQLDDVLLVRDMVASGSGVSLLPDIYCRQLCRDGKLVQIAHDLNVLPHVNISAVYASKTTHSPRLKAMLNFMEEITAQYVGEC